MVVFYFSASVAPETKTCIHFTSGAYHLSKLTQQGCRSESYFLSGRNVLCSSRVNSFLVSSSRFDRMSFYYRSTILSPEEPKTFLLRPWNAFIYVNSKLGGGGWYDICFL